MASPVVAGIAAILKGKDVTMNRFTEIVQKLEIILDLVESMQMTPKKSTYR
jgi:hypothetical protein